VCYFYTAESCGIWVGYNGCSLVEHGCRDLLDSSAVPGTAGLFSSAVCCGPVLRVLRQNDIGIYVTARKTDLGSVAAALNFDAVRFECDCFMHAYPCRLTLTI